MLYQKSLVQQLMNWLRISLLQLSYANFFNNGIVNIYTDEELWTLPYLYARPKFHKVPVKFRFIAGVAGKCAHPMIQTVQQTTIYAIFMIENLTKLSAVQRKPLLF